MMTIERVVFCLALAGLLVYVSLIHAGNSISASSKERVNGSSTSRTNTNHTFGCPVETRYMETTETKHQVRPSIFSHAQDSLLVQYGDSIYLKGDWDAAPIVLESHKLIFFTTAKVGCTVWKQLFRRMMGYSDWNVEEYHKMLPWNPLTNGLKYLYDYSREQASEMMTSPDWTRAIFVREPKARFLSAYLDKALGHETYLRDKCCLSGDCVSAARESASAFLDLIYFCDDAHWRPQSRRMEEKYWPYINFVGHMESVYEDAKKLLTKIKAWDQYGASGWGQEGIEELYGDQSSVKHATNATGRMRSYFTNGLAKR